MCAASDRSRERENKNENRDVISEIVYNTASCIKYCVNMNKLLTNAEYTELSYIFNSYYEGVVFHFVHFA